MSLRKQGIPSEHPGPFSRTVPHTYIVAQSLSLLEKVSETPMDYLRKFKFLILRACKWVNLVGLVRMSVVKSYISV